MLLFAMLLLTAQMQAFPPVNGYYKELYKSGHPKEQGYFRDGKKHKTWIYYNENGTVHLKEKWKSGALIWQIFYEKGRVSHTIDKDGKVTQKSKCGC